MIDSHHHIWMQADLPWLMGPEQPRIFGEYGAIRRDYLMEEYLSDIADTGIKKTVYVQANWHPDNAVEEARWVQAVADKHGMPNAIVAYADFTVEDVRPQLDALSEIPLVRGIRQQFHWHQNPQYRFAASRDTIASHQVTRNIACLSDYNWSFDLQVFAKQMHHAASLASSCPKTTFVLQHAGMLEDLSEEGRNEWHAGMRLLSEQSNVTTKLSAFGTFLRANDPVFISEMVRATVDLFGADRCMFGSNFPIEKIWTDFRSLLAAFRDAASEYSAGEKDAIFGDTASRVYRI